MRTARAVFFDHFRRANVKAQSANLRAPPTAPGVWGRCAGKTLREGSPKMLHFVRRVCLTFALALGLLPAAAAAQTTDCAYDFAPVTAAVEETVKAAALNGAGLLLVKDGRVVYERYFASYSAGTVVPIASASKWFMAAVVMSLVDEGKLKLDDPVSKFLPSFTGQKGTMTVRQLISHTSGLPGGSALGDGTPCLNNRFTTLDSCVAEIAQLDLIGPPGGQFAYGGNSMQVAGRVAEVAGGKPWEQLFQERVAGPLKMTGSTFGASPNPLVAGGARSRLQDYGNFLRMILDEGVFEGRRVLSASAVREMQRDQTFGAPILESPHTRYGNGHLRYGLGEWRDINDAQGNAVQVSSQGAFGFSPWVDRQRNLLGVFLVQDALFSVYFRVADIQQKARAAVDAATCLRPVTSVVAATYARGAVAAESIVSAFGAGLASGAVSATSRPLPTSLLGTTVKVIDGAGAQRLAPLFYVSPTQINYLIPPGTAPGTATVLVTSAEGVVSQGAVRVGDIAPGVFSADASGAGLAAANVQRVRADGTQSYEAVAQFDAAQQRLVALPIDLGPEGEQVYLVLYGTGLRARGGAVAARVGGVAAAVTYAGAQGDFDGLDQINVLLPRALAGRGEVEVVLTVDGLTANTVKVAVR
jgi:serine-type D-Ala-D-Ala carboxypeptidase/endopeptidase